MNESHITVKINDDFGVISFMVLLLKKMKSAFLFLCHDKKTCLVLVIFVQ